MQSSFQSQLSQSKIEHNYFETDAKIRLYFEQCYQIDSETKEISYPEIISLKLNNNYKPKEMFELKEDESENAWIYSFIMAENIKRAGLSQISKDREIQESLNDPYSEIMNMNNKYNYYTYTHNIRVFKISCYSQCRT